MLYVLSTLCLAFARLVTIPELGLSSLRNILWVTGALKPLFKHWIYLYLDASLTFSSRVLSQWVLPSAATPNTGRCSSSTTSSCFFAPAAIVWPLICSHNYRLLRPGSKSFKISFEIFNAAACIGNIWEIFGYALLNIPCVFKIIKNIFPGPIRFLLPMLKKCYVYCQK